MDDCNDQKAIEFLSILEDDLADDYIKNSIHVQIDILNKFRKNNEKDFKRIVIKYENKHETELMMSIKLRRK